MPDAGRERAGDPWWRALTALPDKFAHYQQECSFREAWDHACRLLGPTAAPLMQRVAAVTFKPEAIAGRRIDPCLEFMARHDFVPVTSHRFRYTRITARELWRYQWNIASLDRLAVIDLLNTLSDCLFVLFLDVRRQPGPQVPATVRLRGLKGSALPWERSGDQLRSVLGSSNRMLTYVHSADEPIDVVRELGIFHDDTSRERLLATVVERLRSPGGLEEAAAELREAVLLLHKEFDPVDLDVDAATERVLAGIAEAATRDGPGREAWTLLNRTQSGQPLDWRRLRECLRDAALPIEPWDLALIGSQYVQHDIENLTCIIEQDGRPEWLAGQGTCLDWNIIDRIGDMGVGGNDGQERDPAG